MSSRVAGLARNIAFASNGSMAVAQGFVVRIGMLAMNLLTGILSARFLGPTGRAEQAAILVGVGLFPSVLSFGLPIAIQYRLRKDPGHERELVSAAVVLSVAFGVLSAIAGYVVLPRLVVQYSPTILHVAQLFMLGAPFAVLAAVFNGVLQVRGRFTEANASQWGPLTAALLTLGVLAATHRLTPIASASTYWITNTLAACWLWIAVRPPLVVAGFRAATRSLMSFGLRSYVTDILGTLQLQIDTVLVIKLLQPESMGLYTIALSAARLSDLFSGQIVNVLFPKAAALPRAEMLELTNRVGRLTMALIVPILIANVVTMPFLLPAFFGNAFAAAVPIAQVLALSFLLNGSSYVISQAFLAAGKPFVIAIIQLAGLLFVIPLMLVLIPRFGLLGAAWALVLATVLRSAVTLAAFPIVLQAPVPSLIPTMSDLRMAWDSVLQRAPARGA